MIEHPPIKVQFDFESKTTQIILKYFAPMDPIAALIQLSEISSQRLDFGCYASPLQAMGVDLWFWRD